jgi:hypothetical protein
MQQAHGTFDVTLTPAAEDADIAGVDLPRLIIAKTFHGDMEGASRGMMIAARTAVDDSAGYVAMERVEATIDGRAGSFVLQHSSTLDKGAPTQAITVVPDSATGDLQGLHGSMIIYIDDEGHRYTLEYEIP